MRVVFFRREKEKHRVNAFDSVVAEAFCSGVNIYAHKAEILPLHEDVVKSTIEEGVQVAAFINVNSWRLPSIASGDLRASGTRIVYIDKGHLGRGEYYRVSIDDFMPIRYLMQLKAPHDRWHRLCDKYSYKLAPMRKEGKYVVYAGSSEKYMKGVGPQDEGATSFAQKVIGEILKETSRPIIYRPKPSWREAVPIEGSFFSRAPRSLAQELEDAYCLVTHGSNSAVEALLLNGIPCIVLGDGVARPLSRITIKEINDLYYPTDKERTQWAANLTYCQWTLSEFRSGEAWEVIGNQIKGLDNDGQFKRH